MNSSKFWNDYIKPFYNEAINKNFYGFLCNSHYEMIDSRMTIKKKLRHCRKLENQIKNEKIAERLLNNDAKGI